MSLKEKEWEGVTCKEWIRFSGSEDKGGGIHLPFLGHFGVNASIWIMRMES